MKKDVQTYIALGSQRRRDDVRSRKHDAGTGRIATERTQVTVCYLLQFSVNATAQGRRGLQSTIDYMQSDYMQSSRCSTDANLKWIRPKNHLCRYGWPEPW